MAPPIPFNKPFLVGTELDYIAQALAFGNLGGDGHFTRACAQLLERRFEIPCVLMTPSCTASLELAATLCGLEADDEVLMPSYTFPSTANAVARLGAKPVFIDIRPDTLNIDETLLEAAVTPQTKAIFPVHYAGASCEMDAIVDVADRHGLHVVEDAAQAVNSTYKGRALGGLGCMGAYSFHETKNFFGGQGGALCINDPSFVNRAEILRDKGTNRKQFSLGQTDKYTWVDVGSNYVPSEIVSAFLYAQLEQIDAITARRQQLYQSYRKAFEELEADGLLRLPFCPGNCTTNAHLFYILLPTRTVRDELMASLQSVGVGAVFHFVPLHSSPMGASYGYRPDDLPVTADLSGRLLRLPLYFDMTEAEQGKVIQAVTAYLHQANVRTTARSRRLFTAAVASLSSGLR
jgi:dTDP-4-amino-4,6-dideoxygalactose transaminase